MAIKVYSGLMGSGKTYEVVSEVILGALKKGRRVVSNIAGLDYEAMKAVIVEDGIPEHRVGELVAISHAQVTEPNFWRTDKDAEQGIEAFIQPGDLVALDETWRFWDGFGVRDADGKKRPDRVMNFFRMHRHFTHPETGVACDIAFITQDVMDLNRSVRAVVEETYRMTKLNAVGMSKRYRVDVFQSYKVTKKPIRSIQRSYNPRYFPLYSSHSQKKEGDADAKELNIDDRGNLLKGVIFKVILPLAIPVFGFAVWFVMGFFNPKDATKEEEKNKLDQQANSDQPAKPGDATKPAKDSPEVSQEWRVIGWYNSAGSLRVLLSDGTVSRWIADPPTYKISAMSFEMQLPDGTFATSYTAQQQASQKLPVQQ